MTKLDHTPLALVILGAVVALAACGFLPAHIAFLAGAVALVLCGCVGIEEAYREIDVRIFVMIAGVIPLGLAMEKTGTAALLASYVQVLIERGCAFNIAARILDEADGYDLWKLSRHTRFPRPNLEACYQCAAR